MKKLKQTWNISKNPGILSSKSEFFEQISAILLIALLAFTVLLSSCSSNQEKAEEAMSDIAYEKDERTGLCFAVVSSQTYGWAFVRSIACVPCDSLKKVTVTETK